MVLVFVFVALALAVVAFLVWPLLRGRIAKPRNEQHDMAVYREQLAEVDNDIERGLMTEQQAAAVRTEIHRRMLAAEDAELAAAHRRGKPGVKLQKTTAAIIGITVPVAATVLYLLMGAPQLPGKSFPERAGGAGSAEQMQAELGQKPDAEGYKHLADVFSTMKRYAEAAGAYKKAIDLGSDDATTWAALGEATAFANGDAVVPEALNDFYRALKLDSKEPRAWFYIGLAEAQINDFKKAVAIWKGLQQDSPSDAPWSAMVRENIDTYAREGGFDPATIKPSQPPSPPRRKG